MQLVVATWQFMDLWGGRDSSSMVHWPNIRPGLPIYDPGDGVVQQWVAQDLRSATLHTIMVSL